MSFFTVALLVIPALVPADPDASPRAGRDAPSTSAQEPPVLDLRANRVNRCVDARGRVVLQDLPCLPGGAASGPVAVAATLPASGAAPEVIDLATLPARVRAELPIAEAPTLARDRSQELITGSWKLALLLAVGYGLWRLWLRLRDRLDSAPAPAPKARRRTPTTVVAAGEVLDFELQPRHRSTPADGGGDARRP